MFFEHIFCLLLLGPAAVVFAQVPSYLHICKRSDPKVEECVLRSIKELRPRLKDGLPELQVPPIEPMHIEEIEVANGLDATRLRIYGRDIKVHGGSEFIINKLRLDLSDDTKPTFHVSLTIPTLDLDGNYELNAKLLVLPLKGKGEIHVNASSIHADAVIYTNIYKRGGKNYIQFSKCDIKLDMENFDITLANLFSGEPTLSEAANRIIRENKDEFGKTLNPVITRTVARVILDVANKIAKNQPYDELFPL